MSTEFPSIAQLKRAIEIEAKIEALKEELRAVLSGTGTVASSSKGSKRSAATRAKMAASQQARRAKKGGTAKPTKAKKKWTFSPEARAKISEAQKKRWAALKAEK